ncbi:fructosamine kinase family protein [Actinomycetaceae bacterium L2_0104]
MPNTFVKQGSARAIAAEAAGLRELGRAARAGGAATVRLVSAGTNSLETARLEPGAPTQEAAEEFGRRLARTHAFSPEGKRIFGQAPSGLAENGAETSVTAAMGDAPLRLVAPDSQARPWGEFYAEDRILPYLRTARDNGAVHQSGAQIIERLCERLRVGDFDSPQPELVRTDAALLHGDLWAGNILWSHTGADLHERVELEVELEAETSASGTVAVLIDPACQGGHAESDLAQLTVFSAPFTERIYSAYNEVSPLAEGWQRRIGLHQLHILIVHAALFGAGYGSQTISTARGYI